MKNSLYIFFVFSTFLFPLVADSKPPAQATVVIWNIANSEGEISLSLYKADQNFPKKGQYKTIKVKAQKGALYIPVDVPNGKYALAAFHDEDKNGKINIGFFGPTEGYGFGNDSKGTFSPPAFKEALVTLSAGVTTKIKIKY